MWKGETRNWVGESRGRIAKCDGDNQLSVTQDFLFPSKPTERGELT